ncbi:MAG: YtxH domain-containing protein [Alphaproteobacteria bacterium]|nr:MAG: YtxH domain-containing protein [Alphaproteobacteria bacterium]
MQNPNQPSTRSKDDLGTKARELGRDLKDQASDLAQSATESVKSQAANLTEQAREVASDAGEKMMAAVADQKSAGADYVDNIAEAVRRASYEFDSQLPQAGHYIRQAAAQISTVSNALRTRDISQLAGDVQDFARKQPAAFFGAAVLAGFAAVRFFKSASERSDYGSEMTGSHTGGQPASNTGGSYRGGSTGASYTAGSSGRSSPGGSTVGSYTGESTPRTPGLQR